MAKNYELLDETMDYIDAFPDEHYQGVWINACGTSFCFAGMAVRIGLPDHYFEIDPNHGGRTTERVLSPDRRQCVGSIGQVARKLLGLNDFEAGQLFYGGNTRFDLRDRIDRWKAADRIVNPS